MDSVLTAEVARVKTILDHPTVREEVATRKTRRRSTAERFNVFEVLRLERRENYHSRFIASLLHPEGVHDQGSTFLAVFLEKLNEHGRKLEYQNHSLSGAQVTPEQQIDNGRIDLVIRLGNAWIAIENKIDAVEGESQIRRYREWLERNQSDPSKRCLIFLTPNGREPSSDDSDIEVVFRPILLSYADVLDWLDRSSQRIPSTASPLLTTMNQYRRSIADIAGKERKMTTADEKIQELIYRSDNLEIALEIAKQLSIVKDNIKNDFKKNIASEIRGNLEKSGISTDWEIIIPDNYDLSILPAGEARQKNRSVGIIKGYTFCMEKLFNWGYFGWRRPSELKSESH